MKRVCLLLTSGCLALVGSCADAPVFSLDFINVVAGSPFPIVPGPIPGYVMALVTNNTQQSVEFIVTAESEEIIVELVNGQRTGFTSRVLEDQSACLLTDDRTESLAVTFNNTPVDWPPKPPGTLTGADIDLVLDQITAVDPEALVDRPFIRLVRVTRVGLGDINAPSNANRGIVVRPTGSNPNLVAGNIFATLTTPALSYATGGFPADFGNGDAILYLAIRDAVGVGGIAVTDGVTPGSAGNAFLRETFILLRQEEGPISPVPNF